MVERDECAGVREVLAELTAEVLTGDERDRALAHVAGCADCRGELDALTGVVDDLLTLGPDEDPPEGLAAAVMARVGAGCDPRPRRRRHRSVRAAAVVVALAVGVGATLWATADDRRVAGGYRRTLQVADGRYFTARRFAAPAGAPTGSRVFAYEGNPSWLFVVVRQDGAEGTYQVHLVTVSGTDRLLGEVAVAGGEGSIGLTVTGEVRDIREIRLSGTAGPPLTAAFT